MENKRKRKSSDKSKPSSEKIAKVENQRDTKDHFETHKKSEKLEAVYIENKNKPSTSDDKIENREHLNSPSTSTNELKLAPDVVDTKFLLPFKHGWTRTIVYRFGTNRTKSDIYYYSNTGKRYRSLRELPEHFKIAELTSKNFTFSKGQILEDNSGYETVRDATPRPKKINKKVELKSLPRQIAENGEVKKFNRLIRTPSDSFLNDSSNKSESRRNKICSKRCRKYPGISPTLLCAHCNNLYHPSCAIVQPALVTPHFVCFNCKSSITNNAETKFLNSNLASLQIDDENEFIVGSLENSSQSIEILNNKKFVVVPALKFPRMSFLSNPDDLIQVNVGRILPDNTEQISLELFRKADVIEIDFENVDQD